MLKAHTQYKYFMSLLTEIQNIIHESVLRVPNYIII